MREPKKLSQVIAELKVMLSEHGDLPVYFWERDGREPCGVGEILHIVQGPVYESSYDSETAIYPERVEFRDMWN